MTSALKLKLTGSTHMAGLSKPVNTSERENPHLQADDNWISISGTVESVSANWFLLSYGRDSIAVEMDGSDFDPDSSILMKDDEITLSGIVDDDIFNESSIQAASVYVEKLDTSFYAKYASTNDFSYSVWSISQVEAGEVNIQGSVTAVNDGSLHLNTGSKSLIIDIEEKLSHALLNNHFKSIKEGDMVRVRAAINEDLFDRKEIIAASAMVLLH